jgi:hypothetical protein
MLAARLWKRETLRKSMSHSLTFAIQRTATLVANCIAFSIVPQQFEALSHSCLVAKRTVARRHAVDSAMSKEVKCSRHLGLRSLKNTMARGIIK